MPRKKLAPELKLSVVFEPDEGGWHVHVPSLQGCRTWGRSLTEARRNIREAISLYEEELDDADRYAREVEFEEDIQLPLQARSLIDLAEVMKAKAEAEAAQAKAFAAAAAHILAAAEISLRDAGEVLGLSQEGVRKLLKTVPTVADTKSVFEKLTTQLRNHLVHAGFQEVPLPGPRPVSAPAGAPRAAPPRSRPARRATR